MLRFLVVLFGAALLSGTMACAGSLNGTQTYDLLFRDGTLDDISPKAQLVYQRKVSNALKPEAGARDTGEVRLSFSQDADNMAYLEFWQGEKHRGLGRFPASVGNPMIMFFYESVIRDMAEAAGGSPYYIRNRVKDALVRPSEVIEGTSEFGGKSIPTQTVHMLPFKGDPNRDRMQGFGDLQLTVTMSDAVPGWYLLLEAKTQGASVPVYQSELRFDQLKNGGAE